MKHRSVEFGAFSANLAVGWTDVTATLEETGAPLTLADASSGVGALQISPAMYSGGAPPHITINDLVELLNEFGAVRHLGKPFDERVYDGPMLLVGRSFYAGTNFVRVWYASDGANLLLITYVCDWGKREIENDAREMVVRSIRFNASG